MFLDHLQQTGIQGVSLSIPPTATTLRETHRYKYAASATNLPVSYWQVLLAKLSEKQSYWSACRTQQGVRDGGRGGKRKPPTMLARAGPLYLTDKGNNTCPAPVSREGSFLKRTVCESRHWEKLSEPQDSEVYIPWSRDHMQE